MYPRQFFIRTLLVMVTLAAVCLASHRVYSSWYAQNYPGHFLYRLLHTQVHNGDTLEEVSRQFNTAVEVDASNVTNVVKLWNSRGWSIPPEDEIWHFSHASGRGIYLQFRDGRVVNYPYFDFADPDALAQMNNDPLPPLLLRRGIWPIALVVLVLTGGVLTLCDKKSHGSASTDPRRN